MHHPPKPNSNSGWVALPYSLASRSTSKSWFLPAIAWHEQKDTNKGKAASGDGRAAFHGMSGACGSVSRILSARAWPLPLARRSSSIWDYRHRQPQAAYPYRVRRATLVYARRRRSGTVWPCTPWGLPSHGGRPPRWCALTAPFHPLPVLRSRSHRRDCSLLHVPSAPRPKPRRRLPVRKHGALWCSDFPHRLR